MAKRDGRGLVASVSLTLALFGCGRSLLEPDPSDTGLDGSVAVAGKAGASGSRTSSGGTQAVSETSAPVAGASSAAGIPAGGVSLTGDVSSVAGGKNTGGVTKTGGTTSSLTGSAGRGGSATGTNRTGGRTVIGGSIRTGGSGGRSTMGGSIIVVTTTGGTSSGRTATGGTSGGAGSTATGGRGGSGGTSSTMTGATGGATGGSGGSTAAAMFQPLIEAFCKTARHCCTRAPFRATDLTDCESEFLNRLGSYPLVEKGTVLVNDSALAACASAYKSATAGCTLNAVKTACKDVFVGQQTEGQACGGTTQFGSLECKPVNGSATCYRPEGDTDPNSGTCVIVPRGKNGDACSMTCPKGKTCIVDMLGGTAPFPATCFEEDGLFCSLGSNPAVCKPLLKIGDTCKWEGNSCGSGNYCTWGQGSTCAPAGKLGESCADRVCVEDLTCGDSLKCTELPLASDSFCMGIPSTP